MKLPTVTCDLCGKELVVDNLEVTAGKVTKQSVSDAFTLTAPGSDGAPVNLYVCRACVSTHGTSLES